MMSSSETTAEVMASRPVSIDMRSIDSGSVLGGSSLAGTAHERNIFMRASLQLLDKADSFSSYNSKDSPDTQNKKVVLKTGVLRKASGNSLSANGWKTKLVEVRHGQFLYADDNTAWSEMGKKKTIALIADRCRCRPVKSKSDPCVFELTEFGGIRRLFSANTVDERDNWINVITAAMIGSAGDFEGDDSTVVFSPTSGKCTPTKTPKAITAFPGAFKAPKKFDSPVLIPYTEGIDSYIRIRDNVHNSHDVSSYRALLSSFMESHTPLMVPIGFAKYYSKEQPLLRRQSSQTISSQTSQVWKDMCRDVIVINGVRCTGIEAIICSLTTILVDSAERIRMLQVKKQNLEYAGNRGHDPDYYRKGPSFRDSILGITGMGDSSLGLMFNNPGQPLFDLNESQILACVKDILYACNRTHSGGDTYDAVKALLCNGAFSELTPFDTEAEPMEIRVDIIQRENSRVVVHNNWLEKSVTGGEAAGLPPKQKSGIMSPFKRLGSSGKSKSKKHLETPDDSSPIAHSSVHGSLKKTPSGRRHHRTETGSTISSASYLQGGAHDLDCNTSDEEVRSSKKRSDWQNPAHDFARPLGVGEDDDDIARRRKSLSTSLPPPTITNFYRDKWGTSISSNQDESSVGSRSSNGVQTSISSSDNSATITTRMKSLFVRKADKTTPNVSMSCESLSFGGSKRDVVGGEISEEDDKTGRSPSALGVTDNSHGASSSLGSIVVPKLEIVTDSQSFMEDGNNVTPIKVINLEDAVDEAAEDECGQGGTGEVRKTPRTEVTGTYTRFINHSATANEISERPMCIRVEVRAKSMYKIISKDPQGEGDDTWAVVNGVFRQLFYLKSFCHGKPSVSDKVVSISFEKKLK